MSKKLLPIILIFLVTLIYPKFDVNNYGGGMTVSIPNALLGISIFPKYHNNWYFNGKISFSPINSRDEFYDHSSKWSEALGDSKKDDKIEYTLLNVGLTKKLKNSLIIYGGLGWVIKDEYFQYYDEYHILGEDGEYWVNGDDKGNTINFNGGIIIPSSSTNYFNYFLMDFDLNPLQFSIGLGW
ncbi:hypothetical protein HOE22_05205 [Candidatus Woesearchaeota archaeon]|jgi:hypothetical protein|nr:hypothetical protein [Candidatus Woesearchaeota archaeon]MBT4852214.1 hypothetical protein [Candidatus Neomarinimicrobiota bacterium]